MNKLIKGKVLGIAVACLLVASLVVAGVLPATTTLAQEAPSVSIEPPDSGEVDPGDSFSVDVVVDAAGRDLICYELGVQYNSNVMTTTEGDVDFHNLLDGWEVTKRVTEDAGVGLVEYTVFTMPDAPVSGIDESAMGIEFTILPGAAPNDYAIEVVTAWLLDAGGVFEDTVTNDGTVTVPDGLPPEGPSVSIDPADSGDVQAGTSFTIDVLVDADGNDLKGIDVEVQYDSDAMTPSEVTGNNLLVGGLEIGPTIIDGAVRYALLNLTPQAIVSDLLMTIEFTVNEDAELGDYDLTITVADLLDEDGVKIPDVATNDGVVTVIPAGPAIVDDTYGPTALDERLRDPICTIPEEATNLAIGLTTEEASPGPDMDLELYDGATTLVIGDGGVIDSAPGGSYEDDDFGYSGYSGGEEYITAGGPLGRAYNLMVYAFEAGSYTVTVHYEMPTPPNPPPEIDIEVTASTPTVGEPVTVTVTATDPDGVAMVYFMVSSTWPGGLSVGMAAPQVAYEDIVGVVVSFADEASLTFAPGWAGTYTVDAWAADELDNMTPEGNPVTETFEVVA